jgi:GAF domain-containing protein
MAREEDWAQARRLFVDHENAHTEDPANVGSSTSASVLAQADLGPLGEEFLGLSRDLFTVPSETGVIGVLERVVWRAVALVPAASMLSVTLRGTDGGFSTPVETDPLATRADHIQYETGEGPCVEATATSSTGFSSSSDLTRDDRYPRFGPRVVELGLTAVCSTGMFPGGDPPRLGSLNYYFTNAADFATVDQDMMLLLAAHAAVAVQAARGLEMATLRSAQLTEALQSRDVIGQAKGILMERRKVGADEAFDILRKASQDLNVKLRDIAETIAGRHAEL